MDTKWLSMVLVASTTTLPQKHTFWTLGKEEGKVAAPMMSSRRSSWVLTVCSFTNLGRRGLSVLSSWPPWRTRRHGGQVVAAATSSSGHARWQSLVVLARCVLHAFVENLWLDLQVEKLGTGRACYICMCVFLLILALLSNTICIVVGMPTCVMYICREPKETALSPWHFCRSAHLELLLMSIHWHLGPKQKQQRPGYIAWARTLMFMVLECIISLRGCFSCVWVYVHMMCALCWCGSSPSLM
jgi:hypothetical protein